MRVADYRYSIIRGHRDTNVGAAFRFKPGQVPANKGLRRPGWAPGRMAATQFKKGQSPGNTMPLWTFRWVTDGKGRQYLMLKTGKPGPKPWNGWEWVHRMIWELETVRIQLKAHEIMGRQFDNDPFFPVSEEERAERAALELRGKPNGHAH